MRISNRFSRFNRFSVTAKVQVRGFQSDHRFGSKTSATTATTREVGLTQFMSRVYARSAIGVVGSVATSCALMPFAMSHPLECVGFGILASFGSIFGISGIKPELKSRTERNGETVHYSENPIGRELSYGVLSIGMGISLAPMMGLIVDVDPAIVPASLMITSGILGGCAYISAKYGNESLMKWKGPLMAGLGTLIVTQLVGLGSSLIFGPGIFSAMLHNVDVYGGIGLFTLFGIYDTYIARMMYKKGEADDLGCATQVYLDSMNLLVRTMEALASLKKN